MRASELMKVIEKAINEYGDFHIMTENPCTGDYYIPIKLVPEKISEEKDEDEDFDLECNVYDPELYKNQIENSTRSSIYIKVKRLHHT